MKTGLMLLSDADLMAITGGGPKVQKPAPPAPQPMANANPAARKVMETVVTGLTSAAAQNAIKATASAIKNHQFTQNPKPVADRTHRWLN